jgi:hypothetical protein
MKPSSKRVRQICIRWNAAFYLVANHARARPSSSRPENLVMFANLASNSTSKEPSCLRSIERHHILLPLPNNMEAGVLKRDTSRARSGRTKPDEHAEPDPSDPPDRQFFILPIPQHG